jgi:hypothetical protein
MGKGRAYIAKGCSGTESVLPKMSIAICLLVQLADRSIHACEGMISRHILQMAGRLIR